MSLSRGKVRFTCSGCLSRAAVFDTLRASEVGGRRRYARRESAPVSSSVDIAASRDACGRHLPGAPMRRACRWTTRITQAELAARNRRARFPASHRGGMSRYATHTISAARPLVTRPACLLIVTSRNTIEDKTPPNADARQCQLAAHSGHAAWRPDVFQLSIDACREGRNDPEMDRGLRRDSIGTLGSTGFVHWATNPERTL